MKKSLLSRVEWHVGKALGMEPLLALREEYLKPVGWIRSRVQGESIDAAGQPLPWITYPAIDFLLGRVRSEMSVFEFGSGNSTRWWAQRTRRVVACEHDDDWFQRVRSSMPANVTLLYRELVPGGEYCKSVRSVEGPFDVIVIDGRDRNNCARQAVHALHGAGVLLWDNTDRLEYAVGLGELKERGFRRIDFDGICPMNAHRSRTTLLYRSDNCLGI